MINLKFKLLDPNAQLPTVPNIGDVGFDIYSCENKLIHPKTIEKVSTGIALADYPLREYINCQEVLDKYYMKIEGRSGLASQGIFPVGGIVDPSYRGEIGVILGNFIHTTYKITIGDKIAQLVIYNILAPSNSTHIQIISTDIIKESNRGDKGFGSSGK